MSESSFQPFRLKPWFSPRPWGRRSLEPWFSTAQFGTDEPIGEAWLTGPQCVIETGPIAGQTFAATTQSHPAELLGADNTAPSQPTEFPLLLKLLFPAEKLSVQVHPDDAHAQAMGQPRGKTECWYVLEAEPGAQIALGLSPVLKPEQLTHDAIRAAITAGTLEDLLNWMPVLPGDMVFVDAGTVHAIGPGMVLLETQQTSDTTFRMYDYGRPRELHVDQALRVMKTSTAAGKVAPQKVRISDKVEFTRLIQQQYFVVDRYDLSAGQQITIPACKPGCLVPLSGSGTVQSAAYSGSVGLVAGHAIVLPVSAYEIQVAAASPATLIHSWAP